MPAIMYWREIGLTMYCPNCGEHVDDGARYCPNCGVFLDEYRIPEPGDEAERTGDTGESRKEAKSKGKMGLIAATVNIAGFAVPAFAVGVAGALVATIVIALAMYNGFTQQSENGGIQESAPASPSDESTGQIAVISYETTTIKQGSYGSFSYVQFKSDKQNDHIDAINEELKSRAEDAAGRETDDSVPQPDENYYGYYYWNQYVAYFQDGIACVCDCYVLTYGGTWANTVVESKIYDLETGEVLSVEDVTGLSHSFLQELATKQGIAYMEAKGQSSEGWEGIEASRETGTMIGSLPEPPDVVYFIANDGCYVHCARGVLGASGLVGEPTLKLCSLSGDESAGGAEFSFDTVAQTGSIEVELDQ